MAIQCHLRWKIQDRRQTKNIDNTQTKDNPEQESRAAARKQCDAAAVFSVLTAMLVHFLSSSYRRHAIARPRFAL